MGAKQGLRIGLPAIALAVLLAADGASAQKAACAPWPGEPSPLPDALAEDAFWWNWAASRARELEEVARRAEPASRPAAAPLWRHAACLDPRLERYWKGLSAAGAVRVHRPEVVVVAENPPLVSTRDLAAPLRISVPSFAEELALRIVELEQLTAAARFEDALRLADELEASALHAAGLPGAYRAQIALTAATASLGLGDDALAERWLERALAADPELRLDPMQTSPKILDLWIRLGGTQQASQ